MLYHTLLATAFASIALAGYTADPDCNRFPGLEIKKDDVIALENYYINAGGNCPSNPDGSCRKYCGPESTGYAAAFVCSQEDGVEVAPSCTDFGTEIGEILGNCGQGDTLQGNVATALPSPGFFVDLHADSSCPG